MPNFNPFPAIRYSDHLSLPAVTAPPYDVISASQRTRLAQDPHNFVHVTLPQPAGSPEGYEAAGSTFRSWLADGSLARDSEACMFLYVFEFQLDGRTHLTTGLVGSLRIEPFSEGSIYPHERTNPGPKADRLNLMRTTEANLEPLWFFASQPFPGYAKIAGDAQRSEPIADLTSDGVRHTLFRLDEDAMRSAAEAVGDTPLVVADGHHRYETCAHHAAEMRESHGPGPWDETLALVMDVDVSPPVVLPIHRVVRGIDARTFASALGDARPVDLSLRDLARQTLAHGPGLVGVADEAGSWLVAVDGPLDTARVGRVVEDLHAEVIYEHSIEEIGQQLDLGGTVAVMAPVALQTVAEMALEGVRMPPKTTLFWPKPLSGLLMRDLRP